MNEELQEAKKQLRAAVVAYVIAAITTIGSAEVSAIMLLKDFSDIVESLKNEDFDGIKEKGGAA